MFGGSPLLNPLWGQRRKMSPALGAPGISGKLYTFSAFRFSSKAKEATGFFLLIEQPESEEEDEEEEEEAECLGFIGLQ